MEIVVDLASGNGTVAFFVDHRAFVQFVFNSLQEVVGSLENVGARGRFQFNPLLLPVENESVSRILLLNDRVFAENDLAVVVGVVVEEVLDTVELVEDVLVLVPDYLVEV